MPKKHYDWTDTNNPPKIEEHSLVKHKLLTYYLERYIGVLTSNPRRETLRLWLVDGFAGGGKYQLTNTNEICNGSPLILLETIKKMQLEIQANRTKLFNIKAKYFFVEKDKSVADFLRTTLNKEGYQTKLNDNTITIINDSFMDVFPKLINQIQSNGGKRPRCIFLLDQYGYSDVPFDTLRGLFNIFPETAEVLLTFATDNLIQYMSEQEHFKTAMKNAGLDNIITNELIEIFVDTASYEKKSARLFIEQILATEIMKKSGARFFTPFFIKSQASNRSFMLIHLSCHWKARDEMSKVHWQLHNDSHHYGFAGLGNFQNTSKLITTLGYDALHNENQASLFEYDFSEAAEKRTYDALQEELSQQIFNAQEQKITVGSLIYENCNYTPANTNHFKKTLEKLISYKIITIMSSDGKHKRFSANTIENDDIIEKSKQSSFFFE